MLHRRNCWSYVLLIALVIVIWPRPVAAQFLMDMVDTTKELGKGIFSTYQRFDHIRISGYLQPQYQVASADGAANYSGGDFSPNSNNRFTIR
ncbi:hypothetical protein, partial [Umezakia ovalisporum]|uniref:hypothetical protein n=1 Tax=Umezakia ovalisporum TaxID=75695 RepID=UPI0039C74331